MNLSINDFLEGKAGFDVCGMAPADYVQSPTKPRELLPVSELREFVTSHRHRDQLPSATGLKLIVATSAIEEVKNRYAPTMLEPEIIEHDDFRETYHYGMHGDQRPKSYCLFFGEDLILIPESAEQRKILKEYEHFNHGIIYRTPRRDTTEIPLRLKHVPEGWLFADNTTFGTSSEKVLPKCIPALVDDIALRDDQLIYLQKRKR